MNNYGITKEMLIEDTLDKGPRDAIIGTYRIVQFQVQGEMAKVIILKQLGVQKLLELRSLWDSEAHNAWELFWFRSFWDSETIRIHKLLEFRSPIDSNTSGIQTAMRFWSFLSSETFQFQKLVVFRSPWGFSESCGIQNLLEFRNLESKSLWNSEA